MAAKRDSAARQRREGGKSGAPTPGRDSGGGDRAGKERRGLQALEGRGGAVEPDQIDGLIHQRVRLGIVSALAVADSLSFKELKQVLHTTDGNLSVHARKLEEAGYLKCSKRFEDRVPLTEYRLTSSGRKALRRYLDHMAALIEVTRES